MTRNIKKLNKCNEHKEMWRNCEMYRNVKEWKEIQRNENNKKRKCKEIKDMQWAIRNATKCKPITKMQSNTKK